jgi:hypothetical protein
MGKREGPTQDSDDRAPQPRPPARMPSTQKETVVPPPPSLKPGVPERQLPPDDPSRLKSAALTHVTPTTTERQFEVKIFMAALGTQNNGSQQEEPAVVPGAVSVGAHYGSAADRSGMRDSFATQPPGPSEPKIIAHLAPDEDDVEARIAKRLETKITQNLEEHLRQKVEVTSVSGAHANNIVVATEVQETRSSCCALPKRTVRILAVLIVLMIGGLAGFLVYWFVSEDDDPSPSPTLAQNGLQWNPLKEELQPWISPTEANLLAFNDPTSPQSQALAWLAVDPIATSTGRSTEKVLERYVLAVLFYGTAGLSWYRSADFLSSTDVCTWNEVYNATGGEFGVYCSPDDETVDTLILQENNLRGSMPWELVLLTNLRILNLDDNRLDGTIPTRIHELAKLDTLWLYSNDLTGPLPETLSTQMQFLDLSENALSGTIPSAWGASMPILEELQLHFNELTGTMPSSLGDIATLDDFSFFGNSITGSVDPFFCDGFVWFWLEADCNEVQCSCCVSCCYDDKPECV